MSVAEMDPLTAVCEWNRKHPDGTHVIWETAMGRTLTRTRGNALVIQGRAYVYLLGVHGAKPLDEIQPCHCRWVKYNRPGRPGKWTQGVWANQEAMLAEIDAQLANDPSIVSHEITNVAPASG